jgi:hypothetical protein
MRQLLFTGTRSHRLTNPQPFVVISSSRNSDLGGKEPLIWLRTSSSNAGLLSKSYRAEPIFRTELDSKPKASFLALKQKSKTATSCMPPSVNSHQVHLASKSFSKGQLTSGSLAQCMSVEIRKPVRAGFPIQTYNSSIPFAMLSSEFRRELKSEQKSATR